jgi:thymidylate synthase (FAD)
MIEANYICHSGDDLLVVNAARVSFAKRSEWIARRGDVHLDNDGLYFHDVLPAADRRLIEYLASHNHWSPFAHPQITLHIKAPVFVRTQCFKHKVGFVENEVSRRYVDDEPEFYSPEAWRGRAENKKQGSGWDLNANDNLKSFGTYQTAMSWARHAYEELLLRGVAPEQARMVLPQSMMTEWFWTGSLAAWARFCKQRGSKDAQAETGDVARAAAAIIEPLFPVSWKALVG